MAVARLGLSSDICKHNLTKPLYIIVIHNQKSKFRKIYIYVIRLQLKFSLQFLKKHATSYIVLIAYIVFHGLNCVILMCFLVSHELFDNQCVIVTVRIFCYRKVQFKQSQFSSYLQRFSAHQHVIHVMKFKIFL